MDGFYGYAARGKNAWWRYVLAPVLACLIAMLGAVVLGLVLQLLHLLPADLATQALDPRSPGLFFGFNGLIFGALLAGFAVGAKIVHGKAVTDLLGAWRWRDVLVGALIWLAALAVLTIIDVIIAPAGFTKTATSRTGGLIIAAVLGLALQTLAEEYVFRGYVTQGLLLATRQPVVTAVISGLIFGVMHLPNGLPQAANAMVLGVCLALIAMRTGGLGFGWGLHFTNNLFGAVVLVSKNDVFAGTSALFAQDTPRLMWWDTASSAVAIILIAALVLWKYPRLPQKGNGLEFVAVPN